MSPASQVDSLPAKPLGKLLRHNTWPPLGSSVASHVSAALATLMHKSRQLGAQAGGPFLPQDLCLMHQEGQLLPVILRRGTGDAEDGGDIV